MARAAGPRQPRAIPARRRRRSRPGDRAPRANRAGRREQSVGAALEAALASAKTRLAATYFWPCQSHASLAPSCAVADVRGDAATVWTSSQVTYGLRATLARVFGLVPEKMRVVFMEGSGSVRHERRRSRGGRCGAPLEDDRQARARAVVASGRARLGSEGTAAVARSACRTRRIAAGWWRGTRRCGFPPTAAARGSCSRRSPRASPRTTAGTPPRSSRTATRRMPPITCGCSRTGCATRRSIRPTCAPPASLPTSSRSRVSPTRSRPRCESIRSSSGRPA